MENGEKKAIYESRPVLSHLHMLGINQKLPYCLMLSESCVGYVCGRTFVIENVRNHGQNVVWIGGVGCEIVNIIKNCNEFGGIRVSILIKNSINLSYEMALISLDESNDQYHKKQQKLIKIDNSMITDEIPLMIFDALGENLLLVTKEDIYTYLRVYDCLTFKETQMKNLEKEAKFIKVFVYKKESYLVLYTGFELLLYSTSLSINGNINPEYCLRSAYDINKFLKDGENFIQMEFGGIESNQIVGMFLSDFGELLMCGVGDEGVENVIKIDVRAYQNTMKLVSETKNKSESVPSKISTLKLLRSCSESMIVLPTRLAIHANRIILSYGESRRFIYLSLSMLSHLTYTFFTTDDRIFLPYEEINLEGVEEETCLAKGMFVLHMDISRDLCSCGVIIKDEIGGIWVGVIDVVAMLVEGESKGKGKGVIGVYGNLGCKGVCTSTAYSEKEGFLFLLSESSKSQSILSMYSLPASAPILNEFTSSCSQLLCWSETLKEKTHQLSIHPLCPFILLIQEEHVRIHGYSSFKLFEVSFSFNVGYCFTGGYSELGDKIVLLTSNGLYVIDTYVMEVKEVLQVGGVYGKIPKRAIWGSFDMTVEYGGTGGGANMIVSIENYCKWKILGSIPCSSNFQSSQLCCSPHNSPQCTIQMDRISKLLIYCFGGQIKFYTFEMELVSSIELEAETILLSSEMQLLFVGCANGYVYVFRWPGIAYKNSNVELEDLEVVGCFDVGVGKILTIGVGGGGDLIFVVGEGGCVGVLRFNLGVERSLSRHAALMTLRKSSLRVNMSHCLTSKLDENRRMEGIVKAAGKEVEVKKRNQLLFEEMEEEIRINMKEEGIKTHLVIQDEADGITEEKVIRNLIRKIESIKKELCEIGGKREKEINQHEIKFDKDLREKFTNKDRLEELFLSAQNKCEQELTKIRIHNESEMAEELSNQQLQIKMVENSLKTNKLMEDRIKDLNDIEVFKKEETNYETIKMIEYEYKEELKELKERKSELKISIKRYSAAIYEMKEKITSLGFTLIQLNQEIELTDKNQPARLKKQLEVAQKLQGVRDWNELLVVQHRELEFEKEEAEKRANIIESQHEKLQMEIKIYDESLKEISSKMSEMDDKFFEENRRKIVLHEKVEEAIKKVAELKAIRNKMKQSVVKIITKPSSQSLHLKKKSMVKIIEEKENANKFGLQTASNWKKEKEFVRYSKPSLNISFENEEFEYEFLAEKRDNVCEKVENLNKLKNDKMVKYKAVNQRLINDNKRLVYQLNEIKRYNDFLIKQEEKLRIQIKNGSLSLKKTYGNETNNSKPRLRRSGYISIHQNGKVTSCDDKCEKFITEHPE